MQRLIAKRESALHTQRCPDFPRPAQWLNAPPLRLDRQLRGKVVLLDFWTFCCINCLHMLPQLADLEKRCEGQPFQVVGVHSAKFANEGTAAALHSAVLRRVYLSLPMLTAVCLCSSSCRDAVLSIAFGYATIHAVVIHKMLQAGLMHTACMLLVIFSAASSARTLCKLSIFMCVCIDDSVINMTRNSAWANALRLQVRRAASSHQ